MTVEDKGIEKSGKASKTMHWGMMACCAVMLLPVGAFLLAGGTVAGMWSNLSLFAPIALCIGAHVLMFKMMGKSCHSTANDKASKQANDAAFEDASAAVPKVSRQ